MTRRRRGEPDRSRRTTKPTLPPPLKVAVVTTPGGSSSSGISVARDVELVRASILYADKVELVNPAIVALAGMAQLGEGGEEQLFALLTSLDDETLGHFGAREWPPEWRTLIPTMLRAARSPFGEVLGLGEVAQEWDKHMAEATADLRRTTEAMLEESGALELTPAINAGLVTISPSGLDENATDSESTVQGWLALVKSILADPAVRPLFDGLAADVARGLFDEGHVTPTSLTVQHAGEAAVNHGLITRLPAFPGAPLDELLDLRRTFTSPFSAIEVPSHA